MDLPISLLVGSIIWVFLWGTVFHIEDIKDRVILFPRIRDFFNRQCVKLVGIFYRHNEQGGGGFLVVVFHYFVHTILQFIISLVKRLEMRLELWSANNRKSVKNLKIKSSAGSHLNTLNEHKNATVLDEQTKKKIRAH